MAINGGELGRYQDLLVTAPPVAGEPLVQVKDHLVKTAANITDTRMIYGNIRKALFDAFLPQPGFIELGNSFHTGWCHVEDNGKVYTLFTARKQGEGVFPVTPEQLIVDGKYPTPYFQLSVQEVQQLNQRVRSGPLSIEEARALTVLPHEDSHRLFQVLQPLPFRQLADTVRQHFGFVSNVMRKFYLQGDEVGRIEFAHRTMLDSAIHRSLIINRFREVGQAIKALMDQNRIAILPLNEQDAACLYKDVNRRERTSLRFAPFPLPAVKVAYSRLPSDTYPTEEELNKIYQELVNPRSRIFENPESKKQ
jgi:hypothetical protein